MALLFSNCAKNENIEDKVYNFPIRPGTEEWNALKTEQERIDALQVPECLLKEMSTENLVITCINYPAFGHYTAYANVVVGMEQVISNFNGLQELMKRNDAPNKLMDFYFALDSTMNIDNKLINHQYWPIRCTYFEYILSADGILNKMPDNLCQLLLKETQKKLWIKIDNQDKYSSDCYIPTLITMAKLLIKLDSDVFGKSDEVMHFIHTGDLSEETAMNIIDKSKTFIK